MIISNSDLIVIDTDSIYNLGRFDFVHKFMELKAKGKNISLKNDFGEVAVTKIRYSSIIEQYGNMIFCKDKQL